jgi:hypothetical protein
MSREAIEVGAFTWSRIQRLYDSDATAHWQHCESEGLQCPQEEFATISDAIKNAKLPQDVATESKGAPTEIP